jgi:isopentenyl diphosphate isomerase/L-lactate dehydrogenase-like FMN-dependent dehydrogenase
LRALALLEAELQRGMAFVGRARISAIARDVLFRR